MEAGGQTGVRADDRNDDNIDNGFINNKHKPQRRYGSNVCKCQISSQTNRYRYKFKSNPKFFSPKCLYGPPQGVCQVWSLYHKSKLNIKFQVKPLSTVTSSSRTQFFFLKNTCMDPPQVRSKFGVSSTSLS